MTLTSDGYGESQMGVRRNMAALTCRPLRPLVGVVLALVLYRQLGDVPEFRSRLTNHLECSLSCEHTIALNVASAAKRLVH